MSPDEIKHFLITRDPDTGKTEVEPFGTDYDAALAAYSEAERANGINPRLNTVLISADSLETIEKTHSRYFGGAPATLAELLPSLGGTSELACAAGERRTKRGKDAGRPNSRAIWPTEDAAPRRVRRRQAGAGDR